MAGLESELESERKSRNPGNFKVISGLFGASDILRKSTYPPTPKLLSVKGALALCHAAMVRQMQDRNDDFIMIVRRAVYIPQPHRDVNPKKRKSLVYRAGNKCPF